MEADIAAQQTKCMLHHFHAPENSHDRFLSSLTPQQRAILRDVERPPCYSHAAAAAMTQGRGGPVGCVAAAVWLVHVRALNARAASCMHMLTRPRDAEWRSSVRPGTAPAGAGQAAGSSSGGSRQQPAFTGAAAPARSAAAPQQLSGSTRAQASMPSSCHTGSRIMLVDVLTGEPASAHLCSTQPWRVAHVKTRGSGSVGGRAEAGGTRAQHQSVRAWHKLQGEWHQRGRNCMSRLSCCCAVNQRHPVARRFCRQRRREDAMRRGQDGCSVACGGILQAQHQPSGLASLQHAVTAACAEPYHALVSVHTWAAATASCIWVPAGMCAGTCQGAASNNSTAPPHNK
jgi:hypothetical protein